MNNESESQVCDYCGLPLVFLWRSLEKTSHASVPMFCCLGCRIASQITAERGDACEASGTLTRLGIATFFAMNVMVFTLVLWSFDLYHISEAKASPRIFNELISYLSLLFTIPVLILLGQPLIENAWSSVVDGRPTTDVLVVIGVLTAFAYSVLSLMWGLGETYFEVACMVLVFVTLGRWLEATGRARASDALTQLEQLLPKVILRKAGHEFLEVPVDEVERGDILMLREGERSPVDADIVRGVASVDEQMLTGESIPANKQPGDAILAGSLNLDGTLTVKATSTIKNGTLTRLVNSVREAQLQKGSAQRFADRVACGFLVFVVIVVFATVAWYGAQSQWQTGLWSAFAAVLVSCPCSLGLATPLAIWMAMCRAAKHQILFTSGEAVEQLATIRAIRFDKTGTLTSGDPQLHKIEVAKDTNDSEVLQIASQLAIHSCHVFSNAIVQAQRQTGERINPVESVRTVPGSGVTGTLPPQMTSVALGSRRYLKQEGYVFDTPFDEATGESTTYVGWNQKVQGRFLFDETIRPEAHQVIAECRELGLDVAVLTGDNTSRSQAIATELNVDVTAQLQPDEKVKQIHLAQSQHTHVAMVGDGINDAAALANADVGMALGCGADITRSTAGICFLGNELSRLPWCIRLSRLTAQTIRWNLFWAFGYNIIGISLAVCGLLNPIIAAGLMVASSLFVVSNSLRLDVPNQDQDLESNCEQTRQQQPPPDLALSNLTSSSVLESIPVRIEANRKSSSV